MEVVDVYLEIHLISRSIRMSIQRIFHMQKSLQDDVGNAATLANMGQMVEILPLKVLYAGAVGIDAPPTWGT